MATENSVTPKVFARRAQAQQWASFLGEEQRRFDEAGVRSGVVSVRIHADDPVTEMRRVVRLLTVVLPQTDRFAVTSSTDVSIIHSPVHSWPEFLTWARRIDSLLAESNIDAIVGFAHRRSDEDLVDTWARADAELDRAAFRSQQSPGSLTLP